MASTYENVVLSLSYDTAQCVLLYVVYYLNTFYLDVNVYRTCYLFSFVFRLFLKLRREMDVATVLGCLVSTYMLDISDMALHYKLVLMFQVFNYIFGHKV